MAINVLPAALDALDAKDREIERLSMPGETVLDPFAGLFPFAMLYRDEKGERSPEWITFQRQWANPTIVGTQ
jgi:hypothetical protein